MCVDDLPRTWRMVSDPVCRSTRTFLYAPKEWGGREWLDCAAKSTLSCPGTTRPERPRLGTYRKMPSRHAQKYVGSPTAYPQAHPRSHDGRWKPAIAPESVLHPVATDRLNGGRVTRGPMEATAMCRPWFRVAKHPCRRLNPLDGKLVNRLQSPGFLLFNFCRR